MTYLGQLIHKMNLCPYYTDFRDFKNIYIYYHEIIA